MCFNADSWSRYLFESIIDALRKFKIGACSSFSISKIIYSLLLRVDTIIIVENNNTINFISETILFINDYNIKNIIIIFNKIEKPNNFIEKQIESLNPNITFNIFYINCNKYEEVFNTAKFIENNIVI